MNFSSFEYLGHIWTNNDLRGSLPEWMLFLALALVWSAVWLVVFLVVHTVKFSMNRTVSRANECAADRDSAESVSLDSEEPVGAISASEATNDVQNVHHEVAQPAFIQPVVQVANPVLASAERKTRSGVLTARHLGERRYNCYIWKKNARTHLGIVLAGSLDEALDELESRVSRKKRQLVNAAQKAAKPEAIAIEDVEPAAAFDMDEYAAMMAEYESMPVTTRDSQPVVKETAPTASVQRQPSEVEAIAAKPQRRREGATTSVASYSGRVIEHGWKTVARGFNSKPYQTYAIVLADDALGGGENEIRGNDLQRAIEASGVKAGDRIRLSQTGETPVPIRSKDSEGNSQTKTRKKKVFEIFKI